jgi:fructose-1,6-bisphosphatase/inositol monophosphatase family enzyme
MHNLQSEAEFFKIISQKVLDLVSGSEEIAIAQDKGGGDYSTVVDITTEKLIVEEIRKRFPQDDIWRKKAIQRLKYQMVESG